MVPKVDTGGKERDVLSLERFVLLYGDMMETNLMETEKSPGRRLRRGVTTPTAILAAEHDLILDVVRALERGLDESARVDRSIWEDAVAFLRSFGTQHHAKENIVLLAALERQGLSSSDQTTQAMVEEHEEEAALLESMAGFLRDVASDDPNAVGEFRRVARAYCVHLAGHMEHEVRHLFPLVDRMLSPEDERDVLHRFLLYGHTAGGEDEYERLLAVAAKVRRVSS